MRTLIAANWKMFKTRAEARQTARELVSLLHNDWPADRDVLLFAPFTALAATAEAVAGSPVAVGAQDVYPAAEGAFTGEISVPMLRELGVDYCIVGHSERRQYFGETDETVNLKLKKLLRESDITPILCVGEVLAEREKGVQNEVVSGQLEKDLGGLTAEEAGRLVIAYEPVWAIGTGKTATPEQAGEMCAMIRNAVSEMFDEDTCDSVIIQYGGSVKPENATEIMNMDEIDGALVGGASLDPEKFMDIINF